MGKKYLDVNLAIDVLEKQVSENAGASFFVFVVVVVVFFSRVSSER